MHDHDLDALAREARRKRRLPAEATCDGCGTTKQPSLRPDGRVLCYACVQLENGRRPFEEDHIAGRVNLAGLVVRLDPNAHRDVTDLRLQLGTSDWPTAGGDPLLILAHFLAGLATLLVILGAWLVELAAEAADRLGAAGWSGTVTPPVVP
jgi:hypothetical protein